MSLNRDDLYKYFYIIIYYNIMTSLNSKEETIENINEYKRYPMTNTFIQNLTNEQIDRMIHMSYKTLYADWYGEVPLLERHEHNYLYDYLQERIDREINGPSSPTPSQKDGPSSNIPGFLAGHKAIVDGLGDFIG